MQSSAAPEMIIFQCYIYLQHVHILMYEFCYELVVLAAMSDSLTKGDNVHAFWIISVWHMKKTSFSTRTWKKHPVYCWFNWNQQNPAMLNLHHHEIHFHEWHLQSICNLNPCGIVVMFSFCLVGIFVGCRMLQSHNFGHSHWQLSTTLSLLVNKYEVFIACGWCFVDDIFCVCASGPRLTSCTWSLTSVASLSQRT